MSVSCAAQAEARESGQAPSAAADEAAAAAAPPDPVLRSQLARPTQVTKDEHSITLSVARAAWLAGESDDMVRLLLMVPGMPGSCEVLVRAVMAQFHALFHESGFKF